MIRSPIYAGEMEVVDAAEAAMEPMRNFMLANTRRADLQTMLNISQTPEVETLEEIPSVVVSSFLLSELKTAFKIGVKIYLPFLVLDIIVANILLGMGMMVLPPLIISLPFKIMLFVLMDGWTLLITSMTSSFGVIFRYRIPCRLKAIFLGQQALLTVAYVSGPIL